MYVMCSIPELLGKPRAFYLPIGSERGKSWGISPVFNVSLCPFVKCPLSIVEENWRWGVFGTIWMRVTRGQCNATMRCERLREESKGKVKTGLGKKRMVLPPMCVSIMSSPGRFVGRASTDVTMPAPDAQDSQNREVHCISAL
jgi:hypothetical protein